MEKSWNFTLGTWKSPGIFTLKPGKVLEFSH